MLFFYLSYTFLVNVNLVFLFQMQIMCKIIDSDLHLDEESEIDLENDINDFLKEHKNIIDIKYQVSISIFSEEQIYCFSAMILYK